MIVSLFIMWGIAGYLACRVAYNQGRRDKWEEIAKDYICFHKSVKIKPLIVTVSYEKEQNEKTNKKPSRKRYKKSLTK